MPTALRIAHLNSQLQLPSNAEVGAAEAAWWRDLSQRALPAALDGVAERALGRAGLSPEAVVAVRRLDLRLRLAEGASDDALLRAWSQALETALVGALARLDPWRRAPGNGDAANTNTVVFADARAAEAHHLRRLARGQEPAWWADRLINGRGAPLDLRPAAVIARWLEHQPARAVATLATLVDPAGAAPHPTALASLLPEADAAALAAALASALSERPGAEAALPAMGTPLRARLEATLERLGSHPGLKGIQGLTALPWRLALLLHQQPSLAALPASTLLEVAASLDNPAQGPLLQPAPDAGGLQASPATDERPSGEAGAEGLGPGESAGPSRHAPSRAAAATPAATNPEPAPAPGPITDRTRVHAGGLLLLLHRPECRDASDDWSTAFGDVALLALRRLLEPLGPGERAAALERERPLLALLCPARPWLERLEGEEPRNPRAAAERLEALIAAIPDAVAFAPGALRQVYGPHHGGAPPLPDRAGHALARLFWRPGLLVWDDWQIALHWPHASADIALRRAGWDLDPGWQPALRRVVRFVYGGAAGGGAP